LTVLHAYVLIAESGEYTLTGGDAQLTTSRVLDAEIGEYVLDGQNTILTVSRTLIAGTGDYVLTGSDVELKVSRLLNADTGQYVVTGQSVDFALGGRSYVLIAESGEYTLSGGNVDFTIGGFPVDDEVLAFGDDDLDEFFDVDEFAEYAFFTTNTGRKKLKVIFDYPYTAVSLGEYDGDSARPKILVKHADIKNLNIKRGSSVAIRGQNYFIMSSAQIDKMGMAVFPIELQGGAL
jgi:hypothetical protein